MPPFMPNSSENVSSPPSKAIEPSAQKVTRPAVLQLFILICIALTSLACTLSIPNTSSEADVSPGDVLFTDDFSSPPSGWGVWQHESALVEYHTGGLRILVNDNQFDFWSVAGQQFTDTQIEVDAKKIGGPDDNDFGVICRYQDKSNFYLLVASSDGYYGIAKLKDGVYSMIGSDQLQYSESIAAGQAVNHIRADCLGPVLRLHVNGQFLMEAQDVDFTKGDVGVIAGAYDVSGVDILFDNFVVKKPLD